jgi:hypothetical protein
MKEAVVHKIHRTGQQMTALELPDIVHLKLTGEVSLPECQEINRAHLEYAKDVPYYFYMIDLSALGNIPSVVRREASETVKLLPLRGTIIYNSSLRARVLGKLLLTAANMFRSGRDQNPVDFVETEEDARAWIDKRRKLISSAA